MKIELDAEQPQYSKPLNNCSEETVNSIMKQILWTNCLTMFDKKCYEEINEYALIGAGGMLSASSVAQTMGGNSAAALLERRIVQLNQEVAKAKVSSKLNSSVIKGEAKLVSAPNRYASITNTKVSSDAIRKKVLDRMAKASMSNSIPSALQSAIALAVEAQASASRWALFARSASLCTKVTGILGFTLTGLEAAYKFFSTQVPCQQEGSNEFIHYKRNSENSCVVDFSLNSEKLRKFLQLPKESQIERLHSDNALCMHLTMVANYNQLGIEHMVKFLNETQIEKYPTCNKETKQIAQSTHKFEGKYYKVTSDLQTKKNGQQIISALNITPYSVHPSSLKDTNIEKPYTFVFGFTSDETDSYQPVSVIRPTLAVGNIKQSMDDFNRGTASNPKEAGVSKILSIDSFWRVMLNPCCELTEEKAIDACMKKTLVKTYVNPTRGKLTDQF